MKIKKIYVGSWYPRTLFHLNELHQFLSDGSSDLSLNKEKLQALKKELNPKDVKIEQDFGRSILSAKFGNYEFEGHENGLTLLSSQKINDKKIDDEIKALSEFAFQNVFSSFGYIYSQGAPIPKIFSAMKSVMPYTILADKTDRDEIVKFLKDRKQTIEKEFKNNNISVYYGQSIVIIIGDTKHGENIAKECVYYLHDAESQFHRILNMHRFIWEEVSAIKSKKVIKYKDLSKTRDLIMEIESEVVFFKSRISQLDSILKDQAARVEKLAKKGDSVCLGFIDGFQALISSGEYVKNLWTMTEDYLAGASKLISTVYQESSAKQMNTLQFVFIISAVASIVSMGTMIGADVFLRFNEVSGAVEGSMRSFSIHDLGRLGGTSILIGSILYFLWMKAYENFAGSKITDPAVIANSELEKIKKMIG